MVFLQRLSTGPTLPELICADADHRASAACAAMPWGRHATVLLARRHGGEIPPPAPSRAKRAWLGMLRGYLVAAVVLVTVTMIQVASGQ